MRFRLFRLWQPVLALVLCGAVAGFLTGYFGTGGGLVLVIAMERLLHTRLSASLPTTATAVAVLSLFAAASYLLLGTVPADRLPLYLLPAAVGGAVGALLLGRLRAGVLRLLFSGLLILGGGAMLLRAAGVF